MSLKLTYFNMRGRGQAIRYLCRDQNLPFEDNFVKIENWAAVKPTTPFGCLPVLMDGDMEIPQSNAILRHLARKHGLYGKNETEATMIDVLNDQQDDLRRAYGHMIYKDYELGKDGFIKNLPDQLKLFEKFLGKNHGGKGFFVGSAISFVDYQIFDLLDDLLILCPTCLDQFPLLKEFHKRMDAREKIHAYRKTEAFQKFPVTGNGKQ